MALDGSAVALAAQGHLLALVWHAGVSASPEDQCLQYAVYDVSQQQQVGFCQGKSTAIREDALAEHLHNKNSSARVA